DAIFLGEEISQYITDEHAINSGGSSEDLTFWQVAPPALRIVTPVAGYPLPVPVECGGHIAAPGRGDMNALRMANDIINLVGETENFIVVRAHAFGHDLFIDTDHVPMPYLEFLYQERQHGNTESDFSWFSGCDIIADRGMGLQQVIAQFFGK